MARKHAKTSPAQPPVLHAGDPGYQGISITFDQFAEPLLVGAESLEELRLSYSLAMLAWNIASMPPHLRPRMLASALVGTPIDLQLETRKHLATMIARKDSSFSQQNWLVQDVHLEETADGVRMSVTISELVRPDEQID